MSSERSVLGGWYGLRDVRKLRWHGVVIEILTSSMLKAHSSVNLLMVLEIQCNRREDLGLVS